MKSSCKNLVFPTNDHQLISPDVLRQYLDSSQIANVEGLRARLLKGVANLQEKFNKNSKYLGYYRCRPDRSDSLYLFLQKECSVEKPE